MTTLDQGIIEHIGYSYTAHYVYFLFLGENFFLFRYDTRHCMSEGIVNEEKREKISFLLRRRISILAR